MKVKLRLSTIAGLVAVVAGAAWLPFFYVYLFTAMPIGSSVWQSAMHQVAFDLSAGSPSAMLMALWYFMPVLWFVVAAALFAMPRFNYTAALLTIGVAFGLALASSAMLGWGTIPLFGVPALLGAAHSRRVRAPSSVHARQGGSISS